MNTPVLALLFSVELVLKESKKGVLVFFNDNVNNVYTCFSPLE